MWCGIKGIDCPYSGEFGECHRSACCNTTTEKSIDDIKREAVKEFAKKVKEKFDGYEATYYNGYEEGFHDLQEEIDELLKEYENDTI